MWVKGSRTRWISMSHNWGASYQAFATLSGQALSFRITSYTTKETTIAWNVAPPNWAAGLTYSTDRCQFPLKASTKIFFFSIKSVTYKPPTLGLIYLFHLPIQTPPTVVFSVVTNFPRLINIRAYRNLNRQSFSFEFFLF